MKQILISLMTAAALVAPSAAQSCDKFETELFAGQTIHSGDINVTNTGTHLRIGIRTSGGWLLDLVHIYAGLDPVPVNGAGNPAPGQFPYQTDYDPPVSRHIEMIPLSDLGAQCGDTLYVAVHADVVKLDQHGNVTDSETAWGFGTPFGGSRWGWWFNYDLCCCSGSNPLTLTVDPLHIGQSASFHVAGAQQDDDVAFFVNFGLIACDAGPALGAFGGMRLDLISPLRLIGVAQANANGEAMISVMVPNRASLVGQYLGAQAAVAAGANSVKSDAQHVEVLP